MAEKEKSYWEKKATDEEALARLQENLEALDAARAFHEKDREQSMRYYDKQRDAEQFQQMIDKARKDDKTLTREQTQEIGSDIQKWHDEQQKSLDAYRNSDGTKEIARGTLSGFDKKAAEIVEKGNAFTSVPFLQHAQKLAAERHEAFKDKQEAFAKEIEKSKLGGDVTGAQVLEARKEYEAAAYERDTAESVLAKYEILYGADSKNCREQALEVANMAAQADALYAKLNAVTEMDVSIREKLESETLLLPSPAEQLEAPKIDEIVIENPEVIEEEANSESDQTASMMNRLHDRIVDAKADQEFERDHAAFEESETQEYPRDEAAEAEAHADEMVAAWDRGEDPAALGFDDDYESQAQMAEDAHLRELEGGADDSDSDGEAQMTEDRHFENPEMPIEMEFGKEEEDHDRDYEMAPVRRHDDQQNEAEKADAAKPAASMAILYDEFSRADRQRIDSMKERANLAMEALDKASDSGNEKALHAARAEMAESNRAFGDYLADRREYKGKLLEFTNDANRFQKDGADKDSPSAKRLENSYKEANSSIDRMEAEGKPWAAEMRRNLQETGLEYHQKDIETRASKSDSSGIPEQFQKDLADRAGLKGSGIAAVMKRADDDRASEHEIVNLPAPPAAASYQSQREEDRQVQR